jgi:two-component system sensor histidine kinase AlgZ
MHPILARKGRLAPYLAACLPLAGILAALLTRPGGFPVAQALLVAVPLMLLWAFLGLAAWYPCRSAPLKGMRILRVLATHLVAALLTSSTWVFLGAILVRVLALVPRLAVVPALYGTQVPALFAAGVLLYFLSAALHYVLLAFEESRAAERREAELAVLARDAQLETLKAQIQPHFLFNSLNSISALTTSDPAKAREMCLLLADFLRASLAVGERKSISIEEELALARKYLAVEQIRFGRRLSVEEDVADSGRTCLVPPLLLQPLVENAVRHGIASSVEGGVIRLEARRAASRLRILVENPYDPEAPPHRGAGIGLSNVRRRLHARYGSEAIFASKRLEDRYLAVISLPARQ